MNSVARFAAVVGVVLACVSGARAEVVIDTVTVGNPGNAGENSGGSEPDGWGPDRICGAVDYVYNIGTFEVTAGQYRDFLNAVDPAGSNPYGLYNSSMDSNIYACQITWNAGSSTYDFSGRPSGTESDWVDRPVNFVSWGDAARFCNWMHNGQPTGQLTGDPTEDAGLTEDGSYYLNGATTNGELIAIVREPDATWVIPSEDEWYKAAYHYNDGVTGNYWDYPTSSDTVPGYVNDSGNLSGTGTAFTEGGTDPGNYATYDGDGASDGIGSPYYRTQVYPSVYEGEWENSDSSYGTFDQGGNVWEWNETVIASSRGLRSGSFRDVDYLHAAYRNYGNDPAGEYYPIGFRVALAQDCNGNGTPDPEDIANETSDDDNGDGIPDECGACCGGFGGVGCLQLVQNLCLDSNGVYLEDGTVCDGTACPIPTLSEWGIVAMALLVLTAGTVVLARRRTVTAV